MNSSQKENYFNKKEKVFGQFWTPEEVTNFILDFISLNCSIKKDVIDPACGDGSFIKKLIERNFENIVGIDIDASIIASISDNIKNKARIINANGLLFDEENMFNIVVGNPPFSAKYGRVQDFNILSHFELGKKTKSQAIEILFLEKFIRLATNNGIIGIILPYGIVSNTNLEKVRKFLLKKVKILGIISLPKFIFKGNISTSSKTCILFLQKIEPEEKYNVFMSIITKLEELNKVLELFKKKQSVGSLAFWVEIKDNNLAPEYYNPEHSKIIEKLTNSKSKIEKLKDFVNEIFCGRTEYGSKRIFSSEGIPFISAKTVTNFGIDLSKEKRFISESSSMFKKKSIVMKNDLLFVRVGIGCIGRTAIVTSETEIGAVDDWIYVIRTKKELSPYYLAYYLQSKYGKIQIDRIKRGVGTVTIPQSSFKEILVPILAEQEIFEELYLEMKKAYMERNIDKALEFYNKGINIVEKEINNLSLL